jgi:AsmA protein
MNRLLKWILIAGGTAVVLLIAAVILIPLLVDVNQYKPQIEARVQEATGRSFQIGGEIDLSLFPWVGLALSDLHLGSPPEFGATKLLEVGRFEARVRLMPLLSKQVEIKRVILEAPVIALVKHKDGRTNWSFKTPAADPDPKATPRTETQEQGEAMQLAALTAEEIAIRNGRLTFEDQAAGQKQTLADLNLILRDVSLDRPLEIQFGTRLNGQPLNLEGTLGPLGNPPASQPLAFDLALAALEELNVQLTGDARDLQTQPAVNLSVNVAAFSPRQVFERLGRPFPLQTNDPETLKAVALQARLSGGMTGIKVEDGQMQLDQSRIDFSAAVAEFDKPRIDFEARIDDLDIDRYRPAAAEPDTPAKTGEPSPSAAKKPDSPKAIDYGPLRRLVVDARLKVDKLKVNQARLQDITLNIKGRNGRFQLEPFDAALYGGKARIEGLLDVTRKQPSSRLSLTISDLLIGPLLKDVIQKDFLEGRLVTAIDLHFTGDRPETIRQSLNGKGRLTFNDGAIVGIDLAGMVRNLQTAFGAGEQLTEKPKTDFTELDIPFILTNGVFQTAASNMKSPLLRLLANGQADLAKETLDFRVNPKFVATLVGQGDKAERGGVMVPVLVSGTFDQPEFKPDLKSIARQQVEEKIIESDQFKKVFEENEELKPYEEQTKKLIKGLFD